MRGEQQPPLYRAAPCLEVRGAARRNESLAERRGDNPANHFLNMTGENYKLGSGARGIDIPISANNESFPLESEGGLGRKAGEESGRRGPDAGRREVGLLLHNHPHGLHWKPSHSVVSTGLQRTLNIPTD